LEICGQHASCDQELASCVDICEIFIGLPIVALEDRPQQAEEQPILQERWDAFGGVFVEHMESNVFKADALLIGIG
jgi:hypothetical protein